MSSLIGELREGGHEVGPEGHPSSRKSCVAYSCLVTWSGQAVTSLTTSGESRLRGGLRCGCGGAGSRVSTLLGGAVPLGALTTQPESCKRTFETPTNKITRVPRRTDFPGAGLLFCTMPGVPMTGFRLVTFNPTAMSLSWA